MNKIKEYFFKEIKFKSYNNLDKDIEIMQGYFEKYLPKEGDVVLDCGAYVGCFTIIASKLVELTGKVIAFEPDPVSYRKLLQNIKLNKLKNVVAINKGLWSKNGKQKFFARTSRGSSFVFKSDKLQSKEITVVRLDSITKDLQLKKVDFIKMDVEGSELFVLKGLKNTLLKYKPNLAIATYHIVNGKTTDKDVEAFLIKLDYAPETGFLKHKVTYS